LAKVFLRVVFPIFNIAMIVLETSLIWNSGCKSMILDAHPGVRTLALLGRVKQCIQGEPRGEQMMYC